MKISLFQHEFIDSFPAEMKEGTLYISMKFASVGHKCPCGCGNEVVTPLSPSDWSLQYNGIAISLTPSIGNWSLPCRSHYWIDRNTVLWAGDWSNERINAVRYRDGEEREFYYVAAQKTEEAAAEHEQKTVTGRKGLWSWIRTLWTGR